MKDFGKMQNIMRSKSGETNRKWLKTRILVLELTLLRSVMFLIVRNILFLRPLIHSPDDANLHLFLLLGEVR